MFKKLVILILILLLSSVSLSAKEITKDENLKAEREKEIVKLKSLLSSLKQGRAEMYEISKVAEKNKNNNVLKTSMAGFLKFAEVASGTKTPIDLVTNKITDIAQNIIFPPPKKDYSDVNKSYNVNLGPGAAVRYKRLESVYSVVRQILSEKNLEKFDDDSPPIKYTHKWWPLPDHNKDTDSVKIMRRTLCILMLSRRAVEITDKEINVAEEEIKRLSSLTQEKKKVVYTEKYLGIYAGVYTIDIKPNKSKIGRITLFIRKNTIEGVFSGVNDNGDEDPNLRIFSGKFSGDLVGETRDFGSPPAFEIRDGICRGKPDTGHVSLRFNKNAEIIRGNIFFQHGNSFIFDFNR